MSMLRTFVLAVALAGAGTAVMPASAASSDGNFVQISQRDRDYDYNRYDRSRYDRSRYDYRRGNRYGNYRHRRCYNDVDIRFRFGHRVRVVERICFDRRGRRYVANRTVIRLGSRW